MRRFILALSISLAVHLGVCAALWAYLEFVPRPTVLALDLSRVEISFSEVRDEAAPVITPPPVAEKPPEPPKEKRRTDTPPPPPPPDTPATEPQPSPREEPPAEDPPTPEPPVEDPPPPREVLPVTSAPPPPAPQQAQLDAPPRPRRTIRPNYPQGARLRGEEGNVVLELRVNEEGLVDRVEVVTSSGFAELDEAALQAVRAAKFSPARSGRHAVSATARITLVFRLH